MLVILPFLNFILIFLLILLTYYPKNVECRTSFLFAAIVWGVTLTLMTEILSTLKAISYNSLLLSWLIINCCLICIVFVISRKTGIVLALFLFFTAIPWLLSNQSRPLTGPTSILKIKRLPQYFMNHPNIFIPYIQAVEIIREMAISDIGFFSGVDDLEYPLWVLLQETSNKHFHIEYVNVSNTSQKLMDPQFEPEIIVSTQNLPKKINVRDSVYVRTWSNEPVSIFIKQHTYDEPFRSTDLMQRRV